LVAEINNGAIVKEKELLEDIKVGLLRFRNTGWRSTTSTTRRPSIAAFKI
jgi:hypothetical protein